MIVYQLVATGPLKFFDGAGRIRSKQIFSHQPDQAAKDRFAESCAGGPMTSALDTEHEKFTVGVSEVELTFNGRSSTADTAEDIALAFGGEDLEGLKDSIEEFVLDQVIATRAEMRAKIWEYFESYDFGPSTESVHEALKSL